MRFALILILAVFAAPASAQRSKADQCKSQAGEPGNPTYEAVFKKCMGEAPKPAAAKAAAGKRKLSEAECRRQAGDPGNPTYESVLKSCLGK